MTAVAQPGQPVDERTYVALVRLTTEFTYRLDHGEADRLHELFVPDGSMEIAGARLDGTEAIRDWGRVRAARGRTSRHIGANARFVVDGDAVTGTLDEVVFRVEAGQDPAGGLLPMVVGEWRDRYVEGDGWRFSHREFVSLLDRRGAAPS